MAAHTQLFPPSKRTPQPPLKRPSYTRRLPPLKGTAERGGLRNATVGVSDVLFEEIEATSTLGAHLTGQVGDVLLHGHTAAHRGATLFGGSRLCGTDGAGAGDGTGGMIVVLVV